MWKLTFVILALACSCNADEDMKKDVNNEKERDPFFGLFQFENFIPQLPDMPKFMKIEMPKLPTPPNPEEIRNITFGGPNSNHTGSYHSESQSVKFVNGVKVEDEAKSDDIKNTNGNLTETHSEKH